MEATHTPHGDGNREYAVDYFQRPRKQPTPLTGTETLYIPFLRFLPARSNPHPSRGRKHASLLSFDALALEATHTPHGDGNIVASPVFL